MKAGKSTRITIATERILMIRQRSSNRRWCAECCRVAEMVGFAQAAALTGVPQANLRECAREERWHVIAAADGSPMICLDSLLTATQLHPRGTEAALGAAAS
jgi:hypothetical protein